MNALTKAYIRMRENKGQTIAEYALILGLVVVGAVAVLTLMGPKIVAILTAINAAL